MKRRLAVLIIILGLAALSTLLLDFDRYFRFNKLEVERKGEPGPFPTDWFMRQRLWPEDNIATALFLSAVEQSRRLEANTLDDPPNWLEAGPTNIGGRVTDIVGDPTDEQTFYVAAASGGIFKTTNGGTTWIPIFDEQPSLSMGAMAMDPSNPEIIYAATGESNTAGFTYFGTGIYKSINAGQSWSHRGLTETKFISRVVVDQVNPQKVVVAAMGDQYAPGQERGIYISTNGGTSWERTLFVNDSTGASDVLIRPDNSNILFAATWQRMRSASNRAVGGRGSGIYRSIDGGFHWDRLTDGLPSIANDVGRIGLAISASSPNVMYAIYADDPGNFAGIYKSIDGGESWGRVNDGNLDGMYSNFGWYFGNIRVRPDNPNHVFALGQTLWRSTDGGQNWNEIAENVHVDFHAMWMPSNNPTHSLIGCDGGVYRSTNNGNSFTFLNGLPINQFYAVSVDFQLPFRRYGGVQDNGTLRTLTGATGDWQQIHGGDGFYVLVDPTNSQRIWAEYQWGWLERSENGGDSWQNSMNGIQGNERTNWSTPIVMDPADPQTLYYGTSYLYRTTNRGDEWDHISPDLTDGPGGGNLTYGTVTTIAVSPLNSNVIIVGTDDANVWVTQNGGEQWTNRSSGIPNRWVTRVSCDPFHTTTFYVTVSGFRNAEVAAQLFMTENSGREWRNISGTLPDGPLNDIVPDPLIVGRLYVASDFGCYYTPDYGDHWYALGQNMPRVPVIALAYHPSRELTAATYGRSMYKANLSELNSNRLPVINAVEPPELDTVMQNTEIYFSISATDPDAQGLSYRLLRNGSEVATDSATQIHFDQPGITEQIVAEVTDGELIARTRWSIFVEEIDAASPPQLPTSVLLVNSYPNPFNSEATIEYSLPATGSVQLLIYNETGRMVSELLRGTVSAGTHRMRLNATGWSTGIYFVVLEFGHDRFIHKLLLLR